VKGVLKKEKGNLTNDDVKGKRFVCKKQPFWLINKRIKSYLEILLL
jgi:hypothetical protein